MGEIIVLKQSQADALFSLGFRYTERDIDGRTVFVFIQTPELMEKIGARFDSGSFCATGTVNF